MKVLPERYVILKGCQEYAEGYSKVSLRSDFLNGLVDRSRWNRR